MANFKRRNSFRESYPEWEEYNDPYAEYRRNRESDNRGNMIYGQDYGYQNREYDERGRLRPDPQYDPESRSDYNYRGKYYGDYDPDYPERQGFAREGRRSNYLNDDRSDYQYGGYGRSGLGGVYGDAEAYERGKYRRRPPQGAHSHGYNPNERNWWDKTGDEISSWFGDEDAEWRRHMDRRYGAHRGKGPRGYSRSDARILEDINDRLTEDPFLDATDIEVSVNNREVVLSGRVDRRMGKRRAEDIAESIAGVTHIENRIRVSQNVSAEENLQNQEGREKSKSTNKYNDIQI